MKHPPRRRKASESPVREVKLRMKKPKEEVGARLYCQSANSDGLFEKSVEGKCNPDKDRGPSNSGPSRPGCSKTQVSTVFRSSVSNIEIGPGASIGITQLLDEELEHIFGFLTFVEVKSVRLVNKHLRQVATTLLRRSSKMINLDRRVFDCITKIGDGQFPVNRLEVSLLFDFYNTTCPAYFPGICAWVKEMTFSVNIRTFMTSVQVMATFPTDCVYKELTHFNLQLLQCADLFEDSWERFTDFVRSILENSPNLQEVTVEYDFSGVKDAEWRPICPVIENLFPISNSVATSKLSYINFERVPLEKIDLGKWFTLNLKLKKLGFNVSCFNNTNNLLAKFLETQTGTLKQLTLNLGPWDTEAPPATFEFPRLEKLEQLRVICDKMYEPGTFADIDYGRMFPCLKKLDLKDDDGNWRDFLGNDLLEPTNTVEELKFPWLLRNDVNLTPNPAVTARKIFTGLKKLEIYPDRLFTEDVYKNLPNLEVLTFYEPSSKTYDDIITGLEIEKCWTFGGVMTKRWIKKLQNVEGRSMAHLQNLKTLKLSDCSLYDDLFISRLSFHVFKKMSSLQCLDLFDGRADTAENYSADKKKKKLLKDLRANFVVL